MWPCDHHHPDMCSAWASTNLSVERPWRSSAMKHATLFYPCTLSIVWISGGSQAIGHWLDEGPPFDCWLPFIASISSKSFSVAQDWLELTKLPSSLNLSFSSSSFEMAYYHHRPSLWQTAPSKSNSSYRASVLDRPSSFSIISWRRWSLSTSQNVSCLSSSHLVTGRLGRA